MSCQTTSVCRSSEITSFIDNKTFYIVKFKDVTHAFVMKDTLLNIIKNRKNNIDSIIKFNYEADLDIHSEFLLFDDHMKVFGPEYIKTYECLPEMYGSSPLDEFDKKIIFEMNGER